VGLAIPRLGGLAFVAGHRQGLKQSLPGTATHFASSGRGRSGVTAHPTAEWTAQQIREAFPWDSAPRYLLRDRDRIFGHDFVEQVKAMGIKQVLSAPGSPWQRAYVERVIGTIHRECFDHMVVFNESSLSRHLQPFVDY
jgi:transposase InsO family protein